MNLLRCKHCTKGVRQKRKGAPRAMDMTLGSCRMAVGKGTSSSFSSPSCEQHV